MIDHCLKRQTQDSDRKRTCPLFLKGNLAYFRFRPEKSVLGKEFLAKKTGKACPCWLYVIYQKKYNQASGDLSGEEDKQQSEQAQH